MRPGDPEQSQWLSSLIATARSVLPDLPSDLLRFTPLVWLLLEPTQIIAINIELLKTMKLYVLHLRKVPDRKVWAYEVSDAPGLVALLEDLRTDPLLEEEVPAKSSHRPRPPSKPTHKALLEQQWVDFLREVQARVFETPSGSGEQFTFVGPTLQVLTFLEDPSRQRPEDFLSSRLAASAHLISWTQRGRGQARTPPSVSELQAQNEARERAMDWRGAFVDPPVRVGDAPDRPLKELLRVQSAPDLADFGNPALEGTWGGTEFFCSHLGFVAFHDADSVRVARRLNLLFGALHLDGTLCDPVLSSELCRFQYDRSSHTYPSSAIPPSQRIVRNKLPRTSSFYAQPRPVEPAIIARAVSRAMVFEKDDYLPLLLPYLLDAHSRLERKEWDHAFFAGWVVIERHVVAEVEVAVQEGIITPSLLKGLRQSDPTNLGSLPTKPNKLSENVHNSIRVLLSVKRLAKIGFEEIDKLRRRRNKILHLKSEAREADARRCYGVAESVVKDLLGKVLKSTEGTP